MSVEVVGFGGSESATMAGLSVLLLQPNRSSAVVAAEGEFWHSRSTPHCPNSFLISSRQLFSVVSVNLACTSRSNAITSQYGAFGPFTTMADLLATRTRTLPSAFPEHCCRRGIRVCIGIGQLELILEGYNCFKGVQFLQRDAMLSTSAKNTRDAALVIETE